MVKQFRAMFLGLLLMGVTLSASGCIPLLLGAAAGAGGVVYYKGNLEQNFDATVQEAFDATQAAFKEMGLLILNDEIDRHNAKVEAQFTDGQKINVVIKALTERATNIKVRVGRIGDEVSSQTILTAIENQL